VAVLINYPSNNDTICQNFASYGTSEDDVTGTISNGTNTVNGTTLQGPPNWVIGFTNVPVGTNYTLTVTGEDAPQVTNLTVNTCGGD
jgi:hypothetical protein